MIRKKRFLHGPDYSLDTKAGPTDLQRLKIQDQQTESFSPKNGRELRMYQRFEHEFDVILYVHNKSFRSQTINISRSGALLKDVVPKDFMRRVVDIVILLKDRATKLPVRFHFVASMIGGPAYPTARLTFLNPASPQYSFEDLEKKISYEEAG